MPIISNVYVPSYAGEAGLQNAQSSPLPFLTSIEFSMEKGLLTTPELISKGATLMGFQTATNGLNKVYDALNMGLNHPSGVTQSLLNGLAEFALDPLSYIGAGAATKIAKYGLETKVAEDLLGKFSEKTASKIEMATEGVAINTGVNSPSAINDHLNFDKNNKASFDTGGFLKSEAMAAGLGLSFPLVSFVAGMVKGKINNLIDRKWRDVHTPNEIVTPMMEDFSKLYDEVKSKGEDVNTNEALINIADELKTKHPELDNKIKTHDMQSMKASYVAPLEDIGSMRSKISDAVDDINLSRIDSAKADGIKAVADIVPDGHPIKPVLNNLAKKIREKEPNLGDKSTLNAMSHIKSIIDRKKEAIKADEIKIEDELPEIESMQEGSADEYNAAKTKLQEFRDNKSVIKNLVDCFLGAKD